MFVMLARTACALLLMTIGATASAQAGWAPPVQMADPGGSGRRIEADGLLGNWFPARGKNRPAILLLGGSEGALSRSGAMQAQALQQQGFSVLQLSYFRGPGQATSLELVPLELFDRALAWMARQPNVDKTRLALVGTSKGAEAALLVASRNPAIKAVIAALPSSVAWPGINWNGDWSTTPKASWAVAGKPMPVVPYGAFDPAVGVASVYQQGLTSLDAHADALIPIERSRAALLMICGEQDMLWPSCPMARQVEARARQAGRPVTLLAYPAAGHHAFGLPVDRRSPAFAQLAGLGGTAEGNFLARSQSWPRAIQFLRTTLK